MDGQTGNAFLVLLRRLRKCVQDSQNRQWERELQRGAGRVGFEAGVPHPKLKLLDQVREVLRLRHYSIRTEQSYCDWIRRSIRFHALKSRQELIAGTAKVEGRKKAQIRSRLHRGRAGRSLARISHPSPNPPTGCSRRRQSAQISAGSQTVLGERISARTDVRGHPRTAVAADVSHPPGGGLQSHGQSSRILVDGRHQHRPARAGHTLADGTGSAQHQATADRDALRQAEREVRPCCR